VQSLLLSSLLSQESSIEGENTQTNSLYVTKRYPKTKILEN